MGMKERQTTDKAQGSEGTVSLHRKGWAPMTKNIGTPPGNTQDPGKPLKDGTK